MKGPSLPGLLWQQGVHGVVMAAVKILSLCWSFSATPQWPPHHSTQLSSAAKGEGKATIHSWSLAKRQHLQRVKDQQKEAGREDREKQVQSTCVCARA